MLALAGTKGVCPPVEFPSSTLEFWSMTYGNGVRDDTQQLRDIQDLIAKLEDVNKKLALPGGAVPMTATRPADADSVQADASGA